MSSNKVSEIPFFKLKEEVAPDTSADGLLKVILPGSLKGLNVEGGLNNLFSAWKTDVQDTSKKCFFF